MPAVTPPHRQTVHHLLVHGNGVELLFSGIPRPVPGMLQTGFFLIDETEITGVLIIMCISEDKQVRKKGLWGCGAMKKSLVVMKRLPLICVGLVLFCSGLVGCVSSGGTQRSLIDDQTFYSDGTPEMQVTVTDKPDAVFHSKDRKPRKFAAGSGTYNEDSEQYVFLNLDGKKIKSGVLIAYDKMSEGYYLPNVFRDDQISFDSGKKNMALIIVSATGLEA
jgi:hypothetical protein